MHYSDVVAVADDAVSIPCHPYIDLCNGSLLFRLLQQVGDPGGKRLLDLGARSGQVTRLLLGLPGAKVEALDKDPASAMYFGTHPELASVPFHERDVLAEGLPGVFDGIACRGVYHHIPKALRPRFLELLCRHSGVVVLADEGIREFSSERERIRNCRQWYGHVISEARRRGLPRLAEFEEVFLQHEMLGTADDEMDYKESPSDLLADAGRVGLSPVAIDRYGPWERHGGGFYTVTFRNHSGQGNAV